MERRDRQVVKLGKALLIANAFFSLLMGAVFQDWKVFFAFLLLYVYAVWLIRYKGKPILS
jgi:hypothetical protein